MYKKKWKRGNPRSRLWCARWPVIFTGCVRDATVAAIVTATVSRTEYQNIRQNRWRSTILRRSVACNNRLQICNDERTAYRPNAPRYLWSVLRQHELLVTDRAGVRQGLGGAQHLPPVFPAPVLMPDLSTPIQHRSEARIRGWMTLTKKLVRNYFYCLKCTPIWSVDSQEN